MLSTVELTPGTVLFLAGMGVLLLAVVLTIITFLTAKRKRNKMEKRMTGKY